MDDMLKILGTVLLVPALSVAAYLVVALFNLITAWPLMWCWNHVVPQVFGLEPLTYWQAYALSLVAAILVKGQPTYNQKS